MSLLLKFFFKCLMSSGHPLILKFDALSNCLGAPKGFIPAWLDWVVSLGHPQPSVSVGLFSQTGDLQISSQGSRLTFGAFWELSEEKGRDLIIQYVYCDLNVLFSVHHFCLQCSGYEIPLFRKNKKQKIFFFFLVGWGRESSLAEYVGRGESGQDACVLSCYQLFAAWETVACQAPLSMEFSRQEYWNGLPFSSPGDLCNPRIEPKSPALAGRCFTTVTNAKSLNLGKEWV